MPRELFPADRGLQARMALALVATPLLLVAAVVALVLMAPLRVIGVVALTAVIGLVAALAARDEARHGRALEPGEEPELQATVERLALLADLPRPEVVLEREDQPNSWVVDLPGRPPRLHVTAGLLDALTPTELEAVLAHELAHVANRDALVMTVVGGPGAALLDGGRVLIRGGSWFAPGALVALAVGLLSRLTTNALSRYRELAADAGAAALCGRPAALASALAKVSGGLAALPREDLRAVAGRDAFHLLPVRRTRLPLLARVDRPHPPLARRLAALERLERSMRQARAIPPR
jgi:heat shock protein HtpX